MRQPDPVRPSFEPDPALLVVRLEQAAQAWSSGTRVTTVRRLAQGASSLTYLAETTDPAAPRVIVKVAPNGLAPMRHRSVLRQAQVLASLAAGGEVPAPAVLFSAAGDAEVGEFFAMSYSAGEAFEPNVDDLPTPAPSADDIYQRSNEATRILARLHAEQSLPVWIHDEPMVSLTDEIDRWDRAYATLPGEFALAWEGRSAGLRAAIPEAVPARLTHGDYRLGNLLCQGPRVTAVLDWEIWSRSDPRLDLGWFLLNLDSASPSAVRHLDGLPGPAEVLDTYEAAGGRAPERIDWFLAVALYKFGATTGLLAKNALKRRQPQRWEVRMLARLPEALTRIDDLVGAA